MDKLGIWAIAIAGAFVIGILSANPVVEAAGGWQAAFADLLSQIISNDVELADHETRISELEVGGITTKMIVVGPPSFTAPPVSDARVDATSFWFGAVTSTTAWAPIDIPDGATITGFECKVLHGSDNKDMFCALLEHGHGALSTTLISNLISTEITGGIQTLTNTAPISYSVDRDSNDYQVRFNPTGCNESSCAIVSAKITYTVP